ncbi:MAG TPA: alpha/beta hydrolase [Wenzhouxiangellaceae bacterium]|nr:alpha/beta hydrolase [Wenzhouxiangellaceae bacterium]
MSTLLRGIAMLAVVYGCLMLVAYLAQARLLFQPNFGGRSLDATPDRLGLEFENVEIETSDDERLHGWWIPHRSARASLLFSHGNAGNISHRLDSLEIFHQLRLNVLVYDYRGYGRSTGKPGEAGVYRDAEAALEWMIREEGLAPEELVVFGRSMGAAVSARLAQKRPPACLVLESAFTSVPDRAAELYWWLPIRQLMHLQMNTREYVSDVDVPTLVIHSRDDEIVPFRHGRQVAQAAGDHADLLEISGGHNTGFLRSREIYVEGLDRFLTRCIGPS